MLASSLAIVLFFGGRAALGTPNPEGPEKKSLAFLSREVPRWARENHCYSCHNNGDAARALFHATRHGHPVAEQALADTRRWLLRPAEWDQNGGDGPFSDKRLARIAFTTTLVTAASTDWVRDQSVLVQAARRLARDQGADGSWTIEGDEAAGSPATYGRPLATLLARDSLFAADPVRFRAAIERADAWLTGRDVSTVTDASVVLLTRPLVPSPRMAERRAQSLALLRRAQSRDGGWGPRALSPPEVFDTALVLLGLAKCDESPEISEMIARGRRFLISEQQEDGSWIETTRPPGNVSYAQRISTTGWAALALLETCRVQARSGTDPKR
jgi:hypothetical protein